MQIKWWEWNKYVEKFVKTQFALYFMQEEERKKLHEF